MGKLFLNGYKVFIFTLRNQALFSNVIELVLPLAKSIME